MTRGEQEDKMHRQDEGGVDEQHRSHLEHDGDVGGRPDRRQEDLHEEYPDLVRALEPLERRGKGRGEQDGDRGDEQDGRARPAEERLPGIAERAEPGGERERGGESRDVPGRAFPDLGDDDLGGVVPAWCGGFRKLAQQAARGRQHEEQQKVERHHEVVGRHPGGEPGRVPQPDRLGAAAT